MENKRKIMIIAVIFILCSAYIIFALTLNGKDVFSTFNPTYLIVQDKFVWQKEKDNWNDVNDVSKIQGILFNIYDDTKNVGYVSLSGTKTYVKEKKKNEFTEKSFRVATNNGNVTLANYEIQDIDGQNDYYTSLALQEVNKSLWYTFDVQRISFDFDGDGTSEMLYLVSNISLDNTSGILTKVFIVDNNEIKEIEDSGIYRFEVLEVLDLDGDGKYELILEKKKKNLEKYDICYQLYELKNNKYKATKTCEL